MQEKDIQSELVCLKNTIHNAIPEAEETIAWGMPTWKKKGNIIHFAVSKNHIGVYAGQEESLLCVYGLSGGSLSGD